MIIHEKVFGEGCIVRNVFDSLDFSNMVRLALFVFVMAILFRSINTLFFKEVNIFDGCSHICCSASKGNFMDGILK